MLANCNLAWVSRARGLYQQALELLLSTPFPFDPEHKPASIHQHAEAVQYHVLLLRCAFEVGNMVSLHPTSGRTRAQSHQHTRVSSLQSRIFLVSLTSLPLPLFAILASSSKNAAHSAATSLDAYVHVGLPWAKHDEYALSQLHTWCTLAEAWTKVQRSPLQMLLFLCCVLVCACVCLCVLVNVNVNVGSKMAIPLSSFLFCFLFLWTMSVCVFACVSAW